MKSVDIDVFRNSTRDISFDVYLKLSDDNVVHVFSRSTGLDYKRLAQYVEKGVKTLFIHPDDWENYQAFIARPAERVFRDPETPQEKKIAVLLNMTEQNMAEIFSQVQVKEETAENTKKVIKNYVDLMIKSPQTLTTILKLVSHGDYLYYHSIAVSIFSMFIARASGQFNQRMLEIVGLGGFLHDIGYTQISQEILSSPNELTDEQWREVRKHPQIGLKMLENTRNIPDEVRFIVYQHHEEPSGKGYPNGLHNPVIYYPAKIVGLADGLSALLSKRPYRPAFSLEEALSIIQSEPGKYDRDLVRVLVNIFTRDGSWVGKKAA